MKREARVNCARCGKYACLGAGYLSGPDDCPTRVSSDVIEEMRERYRDPALAEFARQASIVEAQAYTRVPWSEAPTPLTTRLEEIISLARRMGYKRLGVAFCAGLSDEARTLVFILERCAFEVVSVCCKVGGIAKEEIGVKDVEKIRPGRYESMCNPVSQAAILDREECQFNIMIGLCVGHDSLFLKHIKGLTTVFAVKDRLLGHNPIAALYLSRSYYRRLNSPNLADRIIGEEPT